jgi:hypothetical protein
MTVFTNASPVWILLIPAVSAFTALTAIAVIRLLQAKRKGSPTTLRTALRPKLWLP